MAIEIIMKNYSDQVNMQESQRFDKKTTGSARIIFLLVLIFVAGSLQGVFGQPRPPMISNKADSLRNEGDLKGAVAEYKKLYLQKPADKNTVYNYACVLSLFGQNDSCFRILDAYLKLDTSTRALMDPDFCAVRRDKRWNDFEKKMIGQLNVKLNHPFKNISYAQKLWEIRARDQICFTEIDIAARKTGPNSSVVRGIWECKFVIGKHNQEELIELIAQHGWPRVKDVGQEAAYTAWLVVMHSNSELIRKYLPEIKKACEDKELAWARYASIYDRALWYDKKPQRYGTHTQYNETTGAEELYPLEDPAKVDEWRKELGLESLKDYLARMNIRY